MRRHGSADRTISFGLVLRRGGSADGKISALVLLCRCSGAQRDRGGSATLIGSPRPESAAAGTGGGATALIGLDGLGRRCCSDWQGREDRLSRAPLDLLTVVHAWPAGRLDLDARWAFRIWIRGHEDRV